MGKKNWDVMEVCNSHRVEVLMSHFCCCSIIANNVNGKEKSYQRYGN